MKSKWEKKFIMARNDLTAKQKVFLEYLREMPGMTYREIQEDLGLNLRSIFLYFRKLEKLGYVKRAKYKRGPVKRSYSVKAKT